MSSPLVRAVFALLVVATAGAFLVTQQLKGEFPLVIRFAVSPPDLSPNGDGTRDAAVVGFDLSRPATVNFDVVDADGSPVRRLVDGRRLAGDKKHRFVWNGRDDAGNVVSDGPYHLRVRETDEGRVINSFKEIDVDTVPPRVRMAGTTPNVIAPGEPAQKPEVRIRYRGPKNEKPELRIFRTDDGPPRVVRRDRGDDTRSAVWDGTIRGKPAEPGDYAFTFTVRDPAGNRGVAPPKEIPNARNTPAGSGVSVRPLTLDGPSDVLAAGDLANLAVGPFERSFNFALYRVGSPRAVRKGERIGGGFRVKIPRRAQTGLYVLRVRAGKRRAEWPLAVAGLPPRGTAGRARPLVVLPTMTWQGENRLDDDFDGFADTLETSRHVKLDRPYKDGRLPRELRTQALPLLRYLDDERLPYDLTTDVALARGEGPSLGNAQGVVFASSARWLTADLERKLRGYVTDGGRLASFGAESFRRTVKLGKDSLTDPSRRRPADAFGERTSLLRTSGAPLVVDQDDLGLFEGIDRFFGDFSIFERSESLGRGARLGSSAGRDPGEPAFVAYRLERGIVVRAGSPQWGAQLEESSLGLEVPRVTRRIWRLVAR